MKITRAGENAVHAMVEIARAGARGSFASQVARAVGMEPAYAAKILQQLAREGLLESRQGRGGGFSLALPPESVTLRMILEAVEGPMAINKCLSRSARCPNVRSCRLHRALSDAQARFLDAFEAWTLEDLMRRAGRSRTERQAAASGA